MKRTLLVGTLLLVAGAWLCTADPVHSQKAAPPLPEGVELQRDVVYGQGGGRDLKLHILRPKDPPREPMPVLVFIHGGGWRGGHRDVGIPRLAPFATRGYFCATIEYRLSGEAVWPAQIEDCKCAIRSLRAHAKEWNLDPDRIGVWGSSAGGHLVALLGTAGDAKELEGKGGHAEFSSRVQAVCDWFGPTDFPKLFADEPDGKAAGAVTGLIGGPPMDNAAKLKQASPITYVSKDAPPFLIMHGDKDPIVPLSQSEVLHEALKKAGADSTLVVLPGAGHGFAGADIDRRVADFFDRHLKAARK
jgi:acetyl esterase/lipase